MSTATPVVLASPISPADDSAIAGELAALRRLFILSAGTASLSVAVCNDLKLRESLAKYFGEQFPPLLTITWRPGDGDVLDLVRSQWPEVRPSAIFILGMEEGIPSVDVRPVILQSLNASRELWEQLRCPVVFWLAEYAAARLATAAPDFWRYLSHHFTFLPPAGSGPSLDYEPLLEYEMVDALPYEQKLLRAAELRERISRAGQPPSPDLLPHVLIWSRELARLDEHAGRYEEAEKLYRQDLEWCKSIWGENAPSTAASYSNLAKFLKDTNRLAEAEPLYRRAVAINEAFYGGDNPHITTALNNLAQLFHATGRLSEAETLTRRALALDEAASENTSPAIAIRLGNLAKLLHDTLRFEEAEPLLRRSLDILQTSYGENHPLIAHALNNLALLLVDTNRREEAEPLLRRALAINEATFGREHSNVSKALNNLGILLKDTGRLTEAESLFRRSLAIHEALFGKDHPVVATSLNNLAALAQWTGNFLEAETLLRRALTIHEATLGPDHPETAQDLCNLAISLLFTNRGEEARRLSRRALEILVRFVIKSGHGHPNLRVFADNYAYCLTQAGDSPPDIERQVNAVLAPSGFSWKAVSQPR